MYPEIIPMSRHRLALGQWIVDVINRDRLSVDEVVRQLQESIQCVQAGRPIRSAGLSLWFSDTTGGSVLAGGAMTIREIIAYLQEAIGIARGIAEDVKRNPRLQGAAT